MSDLNQPPVRIHRVTTRRRNLRALNCPLEPELLVAEFAGELPPEVAQAVREHIAVCEQCGGRSRALRSPYELLASLGEEPVARVPDLRDTVTRRFGRRRFYHNLGRAVLNLTRGGAFGLTSILGIALVAALVIGGIVVTANAHAVARSHNALSNVQAAGASGTLLAETDKLVPISDSSGQQWQIAEVIAVSERTGGVERSMPSSTATLHAARAGDMPIALAVSADGQTVYELTAPNASHFEALVAFAATSGQVRFISPLTQPDGRAPANADALALAPDGSTVYVGLKTRTPVTGGVRVLVLNGQTGQALRALAPSLAATIPMPPPAGSLPASAFPSVVPKLAIAPLTGTVGAGGALAVSPDGRWIFDVVALSGPNNAHYAVVSRIDVVTGVAMQSLALPGDFSVATLAMGYGSTPPVPISPAGAATPVTTPTGPLARLYLVKGSPDAQVFVLNPSFAGPTLMGAIPLGGPAAPAGVTFTGVLSVSAASDGAGLYVTQNASAEGGRVSGHDFWFVDTVDMNVLTHRVDVDAADGVQANTTGGATGLTFIVRSGQISLISPDLAGAPTTWLSLGDGHNVAQLLATTP
ncbi:MAG TPA: zf-HC2 domain-containing protein [Ktedonobacterales bacterium]|nr:zf-HC2 domain-containing protein [Ktedonobacterales bacterium]